MTSLDWIVLGLFCLALIGVIVWVLTKEEKDTTDYFLAGRDATWLAIGASIFASNIGSEHLVGLAGTGATSGMAYAHWEMHGWMILILGWLFVPFYARSGVFTMPEFLEQRYNSKSRSFLSIISLVSYVLTKVAVTVYAGGVVFKDVFNIEYVTIFNQQIDFFWVSAIGLVLLTGLYTVLGGMKAVLYTSVLQTPILLAGSVAIVTIGLTQLGGWNNMMEIMRATDVTYLNDAGEVIYHSTTDSMANLMRPALYGAYHHITVLGKEDQPCTHTYDVTGSLCENNDKFAIDRQLPEVEVGDILVIHDSGAHGHAMGFNYNGKLRSAELLLKEDGSVVQIRRAETPEDYFATLDYPGL